MAKQGKATAPTKVEEEAPVKKEYKGNEFVTAVQQESYANIIEEMKADPYIGKMMIAAEWPKIGVIIDYLQLKQMGYEPKLGGKN